MRDEEWEIRQGGLADLPALKEPWLAIHHRHRDSMPQLAPYLDDEASWAQRSDLYGTLLAKPETSLVLAESEGAVIGYGLAHVLAKGKTWLADTWVTGAKIGEIESLGVLPAFRECGIGTALMDRLDSHLAEAGVQDLILGVLADNDASIRLYERRGFQSTWLHMSRLQGR